MQPPQVSHQTKETLSPDCLTSGSQYKYFQVNYLIFKTLQKQLFSTVFGESMNAFTEHNCIVVIPSSCFRQNIERLKVCNP